MDDNVESLAKAQWNKYRERLEKHQREQPEIRRIGVQALIRLVRVAQSDTGQSARIGRFLLGLYNGPRYPFDLTNLRAIDIDLWDDCMAVLAMDQAPEREVHKLIDNGAAIFAEFERRWGQS